MVDEREFGRNHQNVGALQGDLVAWLDDRALAAGHGLVVVEPRFIDSLDAVAMIEEPADRDHLRKRRKAALMVAVPMTDDQIVDLLQAGLLRRRVDSFRVPVGVRKSGVEQQGLARRRYDQSRRAA